MYNQLKEVGNGKTIITYSLIFCLIAVMGGTYVFDNLAMVFDTFNEKAPFIRQFLYVFYPGFEGIGALIHLGISIFILAILGMYLEKIIGSFKFLIFNIAIIIVYGLVVRKMELFSLGSTALVWSYIPLVLYSLNESRRIKTRVMFEEYYRFIKTTAYILITIIPVFNIFLQFFLRGQISNLEGFKQGLAPFLITISLGILGLLIMKSGIKPKLKSFARRKKLDYSSLDFYGRLGALIFPLYVLVTLIEYRL